MSEMIENHCKVLKFKTYQVLPGGKIPYNLISCQFSYNMTPLYNHKEISKIAQEGKKIWSKLGEDLKSIEYNGTVYYSQTYYMYDKNKRFELMVFDAYKEEKDE